MRAICTRAIFEAGRGFAIDGQVLKACSGIVSKLARLRRSATPRRVSLFEKQSGDFMKHLGCAYYPENWGEESLKTDAALMQAAGINIVRIGEFAWSCMEPSEDHFTLDWLHETIRVMAAHEIQVLMCTPTAAAPAWLVKNYPDTLIVRKDGRQAYHGVRQHTCYSSATYRRHCARITDKLSREVAAYPNVTAWQIDNEIGCSMFGNCHCAHCKEQFREWLKQRYGTLEELNRAWGNVFWSMDYMDWSEVILGDTGLNHSPSRVLDSYRFFSDVKIDYAMAQARIIRANHPGALICTNNFTGVDHFKGFAGLDRVGGDIYLGEGYSLANCVDRHRSYKPATPFWITETEVGGEGWKGLPHDEHFRPRLWSFFARGVDMSLVFLWRPFLAGQEQNLLGILEHSGKAGMRYQVVRRAFLEMQALAPHLQNLPLPVAKVAMLVDYDSVWTIAGGRLAENSASIAVGELLFRRQLVTDFIPPDRDLSPYRLLLIPALLHISRPAAERLTQFVKNGGVIMAMGQLGMFDANANFLPLTGPAPLQDLFGFTMENGVRLNTSKANIEIHSDQNVELPLSGTIAGRRLNGVARKWAADVTLKGGEALMAFDDSFLRGQPAVVEQKTGPGRTLYIAANEVDKNFLAAIMDYALKAAGVAPGPETPETVEVVERGVLTFVVNHGPDSATINLTRPGRALVGNYKEGQVSLAPYGVCVVKA